MRFLLTLWFLFVSVVSAVADDVPLAMDAAFKLSVERNGTTGIRVQWAMPPGYYLYRNSISAKTAEGTSIELVTEPGVVKDDENFGRSEVYFGTAAAKLDPIGSSVVLIYQGCQDHSICYPPARRTIDAGTLRVSEEPLLTESDVGTSGWTAETFTKASQDKKNNNLSAATVAASGKADDIVTGFLARGGLPLLLLAFLGFGVLLAFTPCVFPLYPILAATLMKDTRQLNARRGFALSVSYALGLATAFAIFGAIAAWTGENLQIALQSSLTIMVVAVVFVFLALSMFGLFELQLPSAWMTRLSRRRQGQSGSIGSAAVLGFSSAFIIGPCVTAPLAGALLYVARTGDIGIGTTLLFVLGLGKTIPLIIFGTLGAQALPRVGSWMNSVKHLFGFVFLALAIWVAEPVLPERLPLVLWAVWAMAASVFLGAFDFKTGRSTPLFMAIRALGLLSAVYAVVLVVGFAAGNTNPLQPLRTVGSAPSLAEVHAEKTMEPVSSLSELAVQLDAARSSKQTSLVYFTADWCVSCRSIDRNVFSDPQVGEALGRLKTIKIDLTDIRPDQRALMQKLSVAGPPTLILFRPDQQEVTKGRLVGEFSADDVLKAAALAETETKS